MSTSRPLHVENVGGLKIWKAWELQKWEDSSLAALQKFTPTQNDWDNFIMT